MYIIEDDRDIAGGQAYEKEKIQTFIGVEGIRPWTLRAPRGWSKARWQELYCPFVWGK